MTGRVIVDRDLDVVTLTLSQPERRNAIDYPMYDALEEELGRLAVDASVRALVLRGAGGAFAGGTDIRHLADIDGGEAGVLYEARMRRVQTALLDLRIPVVSVVEGACVGGGLVLAAISDLVLCTPDARFGTPIARTVGNTLSASSLARLQACFGRRRTAEMLLTGRLLDADEAAAAGFTTAVLDSGPLEERLTEILTAVRSCSPASLRSFKEMERRIDQRLLELDVDDVYREVYGGADFREGVAAFLEKRPPSFGQEERP
ncbi:Enoyl-CoA hydratase/carnithine racemase [Rathayibacter oskolensis]|uniref:Enoyl-CoA hydratase/carnithine racemase n=1 Tax=Rathayibacter oskolensis TaxID=1891671 RepID=A0A1X7PCL1_9MICO|nr:enoyl-CoA hydratase-related protein [Rathayibacter oskolensis]SMH48994.1 Enoyl-CoA hydratase/carnithine racemase [Rathayibacter oskolensis]